MVYSLDWTQNVRPWQNLKVWYDMGGFGVIVERESSGILSRSLSPVVAVDP